MMDMDRRTPPPKLSADEAREGVTGHNVRYVLTISTVIVVVLFALLWWFYFT
jgi:hypothetical protein